MSLIYQQIIPSSTFLGKRVKAIQWSNKVQQELVALMSAYSDMVLWITVGLGFYWITFEFYHLLKFVYFMLTLTYIITILSLLTLLTLAHSGHGGSGRVKSLWLSSTECTIYYTEDSNDNINFISCVVSASRGYQWTDCLNSCCGNQIASKYSSPSEDALDACEDQDENGGLNALAITFIVILSVFVSSLLVCCLCVFCKKCKRNRTIVQQAQNTHHIWSQHAQGVWNFKPLQCPTVEWIEEKEVNFRPGGQIKWSGNAKPTQALRHTEQSCTICLDDDTNTQLFCGHQYHPVCIGDWLQKSSACPCCRMENVRGMKVYCGQCRWRYFVCTRGMLVVRSRSLPLKCPSCSNGSDVLSDNTLLEMMPEHMGNVPKTHRKEFEQ